MKRAFFVVGPESSGTKMMRQALMLAGCYHGGEPWDRVSEDGLRDFNIAHNLIVFHRSLPHSPDPQRAWPDLQLLRQKMEAVGYTVQPLLMVRDWNATVKSQTGRANVPTTVSDAEANIRRAVKLVATFLPDFILVTYEAFCLNEDFRRWLFIERLGLPEPDIEIWYANDKYYYGETQE